MAKQPTAILPVVHTNKQNQDYSPKQQLQRVHNHSVMAAALQFCLPSTALRHHTEKKNRGIPYTRRKLT